MTVSPLHRTTFEASALLDSIRQDCSREAAAILAQSEPDTEAINDVATLDEALSQASERLSNTTARLLERRAERLRAKTGWKPT